MTGEDRGPADEVYVQVLRAAAATAGAVIGFILFMLALRIMGWTLLSGRVGGVAALVALLLAGWAMLECVYAITDLRALPAAGEHYALQAALIVMFAADLACAVALGALAVTLVSAG